MSAAHLKGKPVGYEHRPGCSGKSCFLSRADANRARRYRPELRGSPYLCEHCGHWHNTSWRRKDRP